MVGNKIKSYSFLSLMISWCFVSGLLTGCGSSSGGSDAADAADVPADAPVVVDDAAGDGSILFSFADIFYLITAADGSVAANLDTRFTAAGAGAGEEDKMGISRDGDYLVVSTTRLGCDGFACLARFNVDGTGGEKITVGVGGDDLHVYTTQPVLSPDGSTVIFTQQNDDLSIDLFATTRTGGVWGALTNISASSAYTYNTNATVSADGSRVAFACSNSIDEALDNNICEVDIDGANYQALIVAGTDNDFSNVFRPSYANNGDLYFEGILPVGTPTTEGERIWRLAAARVADAEPAGDFSNAVSPCAMPNGNLVVLWLDRPDSDGIHELTLIDSADAFDATLSGASDIDDIGIQCSE